MFSRLCFLTTTDFCLILAAEQNENIFESSVFRITDLEVGEALGKVGLYYYYLLLFLYVYIKILQYRCVYLIVYLLCGLRQGMFILVKLALGNNYY